MMRTNGNSISIKDRIIDVWISNQSVWLRADEIAELAFGTAYIKETYKNLDAKVARNISKAVVSALEDGIVIISKRLPRTEAEMKLAKRRSTSNNVSELHPMKSYKVALEGDSVDIDTYLNDSLKAIEARISSRKIKIDVLDAKKLRVNRLGFGSLGE